MSIFAVASVNVFQPMIPDSWTAKFLLFGWKPSNYKAGTQGDAFFIPLRWSCVFIAWKGDTLGLLSKRCPVRILADLQLLWHVFVGFCAEESTFDTSALSKHNPK